VQRVEGEHPAAEHQQRLEAQPGAGERDGQGRDAEQDRCGRETAEERSAHRGATGANGRATLPGDPGLRGRDRRGEAAGAATIRSVVAHAGVSGCAREWCSERQL
jgi:hypothetical protein